MANIRKITHKEMIRQLMYIDSAREQHCNSNIGHDKSHVNYSFSMEHNGLSSLQYYQKRINEVYIYGRGSQREAKAITGCRCIITLPEELYGSFEKEKLFFKNVYQFVSDRYGKENIIDNLVCYDKGEPPCIHIYFSPIIKLNHDIVRYKTKNIKQCVKLESGRWEYKFIHVDKNGVLVDEHNRETWVKLQNYAQATDNYDEKADACSMLNPTEMKHFHLDMQKYLTEHGIEGNVVTGTTRVNIPYVELKEFTKQTGLHLKDIQNMLPKDEPLWACYVKNVIELEQTKQLLQEQRALMKYLQKEIITLRERNVEEKNEDRKYTGKKRR